MDFTCMTLNGQDTTFGGRFPKAQKAWENLVWTKIADYLFQEQIDALEKQKFQTQHGLLEFFQKNGYIPWDVVDVKYGQIQMKDGKTIAFRWPDAYIIIPPYYPNGISDIKSPWEAPVPESYPEASRESILQKLWMMVPQKFASILWRWN